MCVSVRVWFRPEVDVKYFSQSFFTLFETGSVTDPGAYRFN